MIKLGKDLKVGDIIEVWWSPKRDIITKLTDYNGPLNYCLNIGGKARLASFEINKTGMTIEPNARFEVLNSIK